MASHEQADPVEKYEDVSPIPSDADSDNDPIARSARDSAERAEHDHMLLDEEEEREKLLLGESRSKPVRQSFFSKNGPSEGAASRKRGHKKRKGRRRGETARDQDGELMFEMEEGGPLTPLSDISSQDPASSTALDKLRLQGRHPSKVCLECLDLGVLASLITVLYRNLDAFALPSYRSLSLSSSSSLPLAHTRSPVRPGTRLRLSSSPMKFPLSLQPQL